MKKFLVSALAGLVACIFANLFGNEVLNNHTLAVALGTLAYVETYHAVQRHYA